MKSKNLLLSIFIYANTFLCYSVSAQSNLIINEVSQGQQSQEYVELLVTGTPTCTSSGMDLRNWIIDDNNGTFLSGTGAGIASGCLRFKNIPFWQNIKFGTLILIYDDNFVTSNPLIPATDLSTSDNNCRLVIPYSNSSLIEKNGSEPGLSQINYPATSVAFSSVNLWTSVLGMRNGGDAFQTRKPLNYAVPAHAVSWGDNNLSTIIYFQGAAAQKVFSMKNIVNNNPALQSNWVSDTTLTGETPGLPNNSLNATWINSMSNNCQPFGGSTLSITASPAAASYCPGQLVTLISSLSQGNVWSTGATTDSIQISSNSVISLSNSNACNQATKTITFSGITAAFTADTTSGNAPLSVHFTNKSSDSSQVFWSFGDGDTSVVASPQHTFLQSGTFNVVMTVKNSTGCSDTATIKINVKLDIKDSIKIPNVFTPNDDKVNDVFRITSTSVSRFYGLIYNRWGVKVHEWKNIQEEWDGTTISGNPVSDGVYFYLIDLEFKSGQKMNRSGNITIMR